MGKRNNTTLKSRARERKRKQHALGRANERLEMDIEFTKSMLGQVEANIRKMDPFIVTHIADLDRTAKPRRILEVRMWQRVFGVVASDTNKVITVLSESMLERWRKEGGAGETNSSDPT
jgi:hypothetical protein